MIISHYFFDWLILEAKAEIQKKIRSFKGSNINNQIFKETPILPNCKMEGNLQSFLEHFSVCNQEICIKMKIVYYVPLSAYLAVRSSLRVEQCVFAMYFPAAVSTLTCQWVVLCLTWLPHCLHYRVIYKERGHEK